MFLIQPPLPQNGRPLPQISWCLCLLPIPLNSTAFIEFAVYSLFPTYTILLKFKIIFSSFPPLNGGGEGTKSCLDFEYCPGQAAGVAPGAAVALALALT